MLNIAIFEDNQTDQKVLLQYTNSFFVERNSNYSIDCFSSFTDKLDYLIKYDIIFLDIELEDKNGIEIGHEIRKKYPDLIIIIISRHPQYLIEGYRIDANRYLLKPIDKNLFDREMESILKSSSFKQHFGFYNKNIAPYKIYYCELIYIESIGRKTYVHKMNGDIIECVHPLKEWIKRLDDKGFTQVHKSFIVNLEYIIKIENDSRIILSDDNIIPLSRHYKQDFYDRYYYHLRTII